MQNEEPCANCGELTVARVNGIPYCSGSCVGGNQNKEDIVTYNCQYPTCSWSITWNQTVKLDMLTSYREIENHRETHQ